jgi:CheY-like chemotaxis protein
MSQHLFPVHEKKKINLAGKITFHCPQHHLIATQTFRQQNFIDESNMKIIIVIDDDADDLELMKDAIAEVDSSLVCISFIYADEALQLLAKGQIIQPDYIFVDINMPRLDGPTFLETLRSQSEYENTPVIMYSTHLPEEDSRKLINSGASLTFQKPNTFADYVHILGNILNSELNPSEKRTGSNIRGNRD